MISFFLCALWKPKELNLNQHEIYFSCHYSVLKYLSWIKTQHEGDRDKVLKRFSKFED